MVTMSQTKAANAVRRNLGWVLKWKYSPTLLFSGANTLCSVVFQFAILSKLGIGARSDLYFASIVAPLVAYTLAFGALNNVLVPMFVEAKAKSGREEIVLLWNCVFVTSVGVSLLSILLYYPLRLAFPSMFRKLAWIDLRQVGYIFLAYSLYQLLFLAVMAKNCFLFAKGRPLFAQMSVFCGWVVSLALLWRIHPTQSLWRIPFCLVAGNTVALLFPGLGREAFFYRGGLLKGHATLLFRRTLPVAAGCSVSWVEPAVDGIIASALKEGSLTIYYVFSRMMLYTVSSIFSGYVQPVTKHLAELAATDSLWELRRQTTKVVVNGALLGLGVLGLGLVALLVLSSASIAVLHPYLLMFSQNLTAFLLLLGFLIGALGYVGYSNSLYVLRRERMFMIASLIVFPVGIISKFLGARIFGLAGLAAGTSVYWTIYAAALLVCFRWASQIADMPASHSPTLQGHRVQS
jgi:peptidoglycan biosynthesis protein MviN/MurJ (putative lipid II flippase)